MKNGTPEILERFYDFVLILMQKTSRFPKSHRYLLGEKIEVLSFSIFESFLEAIYSKDKLDLLIRANLQFEKLRYYLVSTVSVGTRGLQTRIHGIQERVL